MNKFNYILSILLQYLFIFFTNNSFAEEIKPGDKKLYNWINDQTKTGNPIVLLKKEDIKSKRFGALLICIGVEANEEEVVPLLIECLKNDDYPLRVNAIRALGRLGKKASDAVPFLLKLPDTDKGNVIEAIGDINSKMEIAIPYLINILKDSKDKKLIMSSLYSIDKIRPNNIDIINNITPLTSNEDKQIRILANKILYNLTKEKKWLDLLEHDGVNINIELKNLSQEDKTSQEPRDSEEKN